MSAYSVVDEEIKAESGLQVSPRFFLHTIYSRYTCPWHISLLDFNDDKPAGLRSVEVKIGGAICGADGLDVMWRL